MICDGRTDRRMDRRTGKNNMSPDPVGGRHNYQILRYEPEFSTSFDYFSIYEQLKFLAQLS